MFDWKEDGTGYSYLFKTITEKNKEELQMVMFENFFRGIVLYRLVEEQFWLF